MIEVWLVLTLSMSVQGAGAVVIPNPYPSVEACKQAALDAKDMRDYIPYYGFTCVVSPKPDIKQ